LQVVRKFPRVMDCDIKKITWPAGGVQVVGNAAAAAGNAAATEVSSHC
jgi:hypothetical protein